MADPLRPHWLQHARLPCPSASPGVCSNSCPLSHWCIQPSCPNLLVPAKILRDSQCLYTESSPVIWKLAFKMIILLAIQDCKTFFFLEVHEPVGNWSCSCKPSVPLLPSAILDLPSKWLWLLLNSDIWHIKYGCLQGFPRQPEQFIWFQPKCPWTPVTSLPCMSHERHHRLHVRGWCGWKDGWISH